MEEIFNELENVNENIKFNSGATKEEIEELKKKVKCEVPKELIELYKIHNGGTILSHEFLSISKMIEEIDEAKSLEKNEDLNICSVKYDGIKEKIWSGKRFPFIGDYLGNFIGVDCDPTSTGCKGQIINYGTDEEELYCFADNIQDFFKGLLEVLKKGNLDESTHLTDYLIRNDITFFENNIDLENITTLKGLKKSQINYEMADKMVQKNPQEIRYVPLNIVDTNLYIKAVSADPFVLKYVTDDIYDLKLEDESKIYYAAVQSKMPILKKRKGKITLNESDIGEHEYVSIFNYFYTRNISDEDYSKIKLEALKRDIDLFKRGFIIGNMITDECYKYIMSKVEYIDAFKYLPDKYKTKEQCIEVLKQDGLLFKYIPNIYKSVETILIAVHQNPEVIKDLSAFNQLRDEKIAIEVVKQDGLLLKYVYYKMKTETVCRIAYENNPESKNFMPTDMIEKLNI